MTTNTPFTSLRLVQLDHLIENATEEAYKDLQNIASSLPNQSDDVKKRALLQHLNATKQRLLRLQVLLQWCHKASAVAECKRVLEVSSTHANAFREAADQLVYLHGELVYTKAPAYDVPTAIHVLSSGGYNALPTLIESELKIVAPGKTNKKVGAKDSEATKTSEQVERGKAALKRFDFLIRSKLLEEGLPPGMRVERISNGETVVSSTSRQYIATISLVPAPTKQVTLAKWTPSPSEEETLGAGVPGEQQEIMQPIKQEIKEEEDHGQEGEAMAVVDNADEVGVVVETRDEKVKLEEMDIDANSTENAAAISNKDTCAITKIKRSEVSQKWRWRLLSFQLLPTHPSALLPPHLVPWLIRNVEDRMWAASDIQQLIELGKADLVVVPPPPLTMKQRKDKQKEKDTRGREAPMPGVSVLSQPLSRSLSLSGGGGGGGGVSAQPSKSSGSLQLGSEQVTTGDHLPTDSAATGGGGGEAGAPGVIPLWAQSPLAALHAVLQHTSAKLAIGSVLMEEARALESGTGGGIATVSGTFVGWSNGNLRISKLEDNFGVKFSLWPRVPLLSPSELESMSPAGDSEKGNDERENKKVEKKLKKEVGKYPLLGWTLQVEVPQLEQSEKKVSNSEKKERKSSTSDGTITCICVPPLRHSPSLLVEDEEVSLSVWSDDGSLSTENLLLRASAQHAVLQLSAVRYMLTLKRSAETRSERSTSYEEAKHAQQLDHILGVDTWKVDIVNTTTQASSLSTSSPAVPAMQCTFHNHAMLLLHFRLTDGQPILSLGPILTESGVELAREAQNLVNKAQIALNKKLEAVLTEVLPTGITRSFLWASTITEAVVYTWKHLIASQRKEEVLIEALEYGFGRAVLPSCLIGVDLVASNGGAGCGAAGSDVGGDSEFSPSVVVASKETTAILHVPSFPSPTILSPLLKESIPTGKQGSLVGYLVADVTSATAVNSSPESFGKQLNFALCWATPRGVPTDVRRIIPIPAEIASGGGEEEDREQITGLKSKQAQQQQQRQTSISTKRKRDDIDEDDEDDANGDNPLSLTMEVLTSNKSNTKSLNTNWRQLKQWCLTTIAVHQLEAQLEAAGCKAEPTEDKSAVRVLLSSVPWLSSSPSSSFSFSSFKDEEIQFSLDPGMMTQPEGGAFLTTFVGEKFSFWKKELETHGLLDLVRINGGAIATGETGENDVDGAFSFGRDGSGKETLVVRCSLKDRKCSAAEMVAKVACVGATTTCAVNLATALKQQEQQEGRSPGSIHSIDLNTVQMKLNLVSGNDISIIVQWNARITNKKNVIAAAGGGAATGVGVSSTGRRVMMSGDITSLKITPSLENKEGASDTRGPLVSSISTSPNLPSAVLSYLENQLLIETLNPRTDSESISFLSVLTSVAASAAVLQASALDPAAQHAAGLLPGALTVESFNFGSPAAAVISALGAVGIYRLLVHQLGRSLQLQISFQSTGAVVLHARQLPPTAGNGAAGGGGDVNGYEEAWLQDAWSRLTASNNITSTSSTDEWSHVTASLLAEQLGPVLTALMHSVSRKFS